MKKLKAIWQLITSREYIVFTKQGMSTRASTKANAHLFYIAHHCIGIAILEDQKMQIAEHEIDQQIKEALK